MLAMHDNLNAMARLLAPSRDNPDVNRVFSALARRAVEWPAEARDALGVPELHGNVLTVLIGIASHVVLRDGRPIERGDRASLRNRMKRYHPNWRK